MQTFKKTGKGYSLVEVLIAISILMLAIVGPLTIAAKSIQTAQYARQQTTAFFLAQEGITAVNAIRNQWALSAYSGNTDSWDWTNPPAGNTISTLEPSCFTSLGCGIDFRGGLINYSLVRNDGACLAGQQFCLLKLRSTASNQAGIYINRNTVGVVNTPYTRTIKLTKIGASEVVVVVEVSWPTRYLGDTTESVVLQTSLFDIYEDL